MYEFTDVPEQKGLKIKISSESCGGDSFASGSCSIDVQDLSKYFYPPSFLPATIIPVIIKQTEVIQNIHDHV